MKKTLIWAMIFWASYSLPILAKENDQKESTEAIVTIEKNFDNSMEENSRMALHTCVSEETGIKFACNPNWKLSRRERKLAITVSLVPRVEISIAENDGRIKFLSDFSRDAINSLGEFAEGFEINRIKQCDRETVNVNGYVKDDLNTKVLEFFMVDHHNLHSVKFTVNPEESWAEYEDLIKKVVASLEFTAQKPGVKFSLDSTDENCEELVE